jgi:beta-lactamase regulating signal transducer with metallopeptidase domain
MLQWALYVLIISTVLSAAGWLTEQALRRRRVQTRWAWIAAMTLAALLAFSSLPPLNAPHAPQRTHSAASWANIQHVAPVKLPALISPRSTTVSYVATAQWNSVFVRAWVLLSALMVSAVAVSGAHVLWRRRGWPMQLIGSHCVGITSNIGPAVVGLLYPTIAIPRWVLDRAVAEQELILAHEASHLQARDPLMLTSALIALILMPWNVLLWWQWHRLRHAIEVDCDARVLSAGHDTRAYGEALIDVGQQRSRFVGIVAAMSETRTLLERRVEIMATRARKPSTYAFAVLCILAAVVGASATQIVAPESSGDRQEISVDPAALDRYVGKYQLRSYLVLTVTREGSQLYSQITGQPKLPVYAEAPNKFFWKVVDAEVTFAVSDSGPATSATLHQNGRDLVWMRVDDATAQALEQQLADRVSRQQPQNGSEAAVRKSFAAIVAGEPNYDDMTAPLQEVTRKQLPVLEVSFKVYGPIQSVEFKGVNDGGSDKYLVTHQSGRHSEWVVNLDADGKISGLLVRPAF